MTFLQIENTKRLITVIESKIAKNEHPSLLDNWIQPCGTHGCILGDYLLLKCKEGEEGKCKGNTFISNIVNNIVNNIDMKKSIYLFSGFCYLFDFKTEFGFNNYFIECNDKGYEEYEYDPYFNTSTYKLDVTGDEACGSLKQRLGYVKSQLAAFTKQEINNESFRV